MGGATGARPLGVASLVVVALISVASAAPASGKRAHRPATGPYVANHCLKLRSPALRSAPRFFLKPTRLGTYMLYGPDAKLLSVADGGATSRADAPGPAAEWRPRRRGARFQIRSAANGRWLAADRNSHALVTSSRPGRFRLTRSRGCKRYPEAALGASGRPFRGTRRDGSVRGYVDPHVHVVADLRGGGQVISGESFHRFGITEALGHDVDVHGADGSLDVTGNLLRSGNPAGTHNTQGWPAFSGWPTFDTYTHQQVYYRWLQRAWMGGMRLVVAQTVEDQPLCDIEPRKTHSCDETATIELEVARLRALQDYVDAQSGGRGRGWFRLVYNPRAARRVIARGNLAVIVGVESSNPFGCSQSRGEPHCDRAAIDAGIARMRKLGVRSMFIAHWVDNALGGAALEGGDKGVFIGAMNLSQTGSSFETGPCPYPGQGEEVQPAGPEPLDPATGVAPGTVPVYPSGRQCNRKGLTDLGVYAVERLMDNHMLIEVDHLGEWGRQQVLEIAERRHYPLVSSHTGTGGSWAPEELRRLYALGGFASATVDDAAKLPEKILAFRQYDAKAAPGLSTDTGGFAALPGPDPSAAGYPFRSFDKRVRFTRQRTGERTFDIRTDGVAHYGLMPDLLADVQRQHDGRRALSALLHSADAYLKTWRRATR
jgi:microsomal dipeptidase-like Zn-dependent dipeptidase